MYKIKFSSILFFFFVLITTQGLSEEIVVLNSNQLILIANTTGHFRSTDKNLIAISCLQFTDTISKKKLTKFIAALTAFPFPLGFMGVHRIMLGTKPWVPVVYVVTFGGCFGLLPLIDFCVIALSKNIEQYENNPNIFMWVK